jgi:hypothetical protein
MRVSTKVNTIACQLLSHQEKEGWGPIIINRRAIDSNNKDAASKNDSEHNVVFFATVAVRA